MDVCAIVLFSGPGGSSLGIKNAGVHRLVGVENDRSAVATARAAGFRVVRRDVRKVNPHHLRRLFPMSSRTLLQSSAPCTGFSRAANGKGAQDVDLLMAAIEDLSYDPTVELFLHWRLLLETHCKDIRSALTFETLRWVIELEPDYVMLEQVPNVLPIWEAFGGFLEKLGYSVRTGHVQSERLGVAQTRKRAELAASRHEPVGPIRYTHSRYHNRNWRQMDPDVLPWVPLGDVLDFPHEIVMRSNYGTGGDPRKRGERTGEQPAPTVTSKIDRNRLYLCPTNMRPNAALRTLDQPAGTMAFGHDRPRWITQEEVDAFYESRVNNQSGTEFDYAEQASQPSSVIAGRGLSTFRGANANRFNGSTKSRNDGFKLTVQEAGILQSFPAEYPWSGSNQFLQVGNSVPPLMQEALTRQLLGL